MYLNVLLRFEPGISHVTNFYSGSGVVTDNRTRSVILVGVQRMSVKRILYLRACVSSIQVVLHRSIQDVLVRRLGVEACLLR